MLIWMTKISKFCVANFLALTAGVLLCNLRAHADSVYSAVAAFQSSYNSALPVLPPVSGEFEFGYYNDTTPILTPFNEKASIGGLDFLQSNVVQDSLVPAVFYNPSNAQTTFGSLTLDAHQLAFHPGVNTDAVIRFYAPSAGTYAFSAGFEGADTTTTLLKVIENGVTVLDQGNVTGFHSTTYSFDQQVTLAAGGYVDFAVNNNGNFSNDSTAVIADLTVTAVPLPASAGIGFSLLGGFGSLSLLRKRFSRRIRIA